MHVPSITVLMPVYNAEKYLREAIDSILQQTFTDFEFLIINDGSTDRSEEIILTYTDPRIRYEKNEQNIKLIATLNKGFELVTTKYVVRADADDINSLNRLELQYKFMEQHPDVGLSGTAYESFGEGKLPAVVRYAPDHNTICWKHFYQIHLSHGTSIFRMSVVRKHNLFFDAAFAHAEDYELFTRFSRVSRLANLQQVLYKVRHHEHEVSRLFSNVQKENSFRVKQRQFQAMGFMATTKEIELFGKIAQHEYEKSEGFIADARSLLERLVEANRKTAFVEITFFNKHIGQFWFNVAYNCSSVGLFAWKEFFASPLHKNISLDAFARIKFLMKVLIKK
ncbi:MAG: glycosyltransferase family A protein [Bacteroidetes bacterium]|nr:glycosyltransferase family A protein [Bacteroidota bacterium]